MNRFTQKAKNALNRALARAREMGHIYVGTEHLLLGLLGEPDSIAERILTGRGVRHEKIRQILKERSGVGEESSVTAADMTPRLKEVIATAGELSGQAGHSFVGTEHLLLALMESVECEALSVLVAAGVSPLDIRGDVSGCLLDGTEDVLKPKTYKPNEGEKAYPHLKAYGRDLTAMAETGKTDPVIGRQTETERIIRILSRRTKNNPCLIGEPGVGKTAVVEGIAHRIAKGNVPEDLKGRRIIMLDIASMIAGAKYRGEFEERMRGVLAEAEKNDRVILFIDEIHTIIGAGGAEGALDAANILKPALARGELQVIGATTIDEYRRHIEKDAALTRRFQSVLLEEPTPEEAKAILLGLRDTYEAHHRLTIGEDAIDAAVKLSVRYISDRYLPDKAIDLIDEAAAKKRLTVAEGKSGATLPDKIAAARAEKEKAILRTDLENAYWWRAEEERLSESLSAGKQTPVQTVTVTAADVGEIVTAATGIPVFRLEEEESVRLSRLEALLSARVVGQTAAVEAVARAIRRGRTGLTDPKRPLGSFLFVGPTGVGKTELAKALSDVMYGGEEALIRLDMSEYMEKFTTSRMIGSPPGYVGYDDGGQLTEKVRRHPYSVVLLDEIEKAHPDVFHLFLEVLEDGTLTDAKGRRVDFRNTVVIMTSNAGTAFSTTGSLGFQAETAREKSEITAALKDTFPPEFLNRIDEIIHFSRLTKEDLSEIAARMLAEETKRIAALGITVHFSPEIVSHLAETAGNTMFGARPLRRAVVRHIEDTLSEQMLRGRIRFGDTIEAQLSGETVAYTVKGPSALVSME